MTAPERRKAPAVTGALLSGSALVGGSSEAEDTTFEVVGYAACCPFAPDSDCCARIFPDADRWTCACHGASASLSLYSHAVGLEFLAATTEVEAVGAVEPVL